MSRVKVFAILLAVILVLIVVLQNRDQVQTQLLFVTVSMPRALLLFVTLLIGFALGLAVAGRIRRSGKKKKAEATS